MAVETASRTFSVSLPPDLAEKAEAMAQRQSRSVSELLGEAFRNYYSHSEDVCEILRRAGTYASSLDCELTEEDVDRVIHEVRAEAAQERSPGH